MVVFPGEINIKHFKQKNLNEPVQVFLLKVLHEKKRGTKLQSEVNQLLRSLLRDC